MFVNRIKALSLSLTGVAVAFLLQILLVPILGWKTPFITFFLAVIFGAWIDGFFGGSIATVVSAVVVGYFLRHGHLDGLPSHSEVIARVLFMLEGFAISALGQSQLISKRKAAGNAAAAAASALQARDSITTVEESEARSAAVLKVALDCIVTMDQDGTIKEFNPAAETAFGYTRESVIGRTVSEIMIPPNMREQHAAGLVRYLEIGEGPVVGNRIEITAIRKGGEIFPVELAVVPIRVAGRLEFTAYIRDISERKSAERALEAFSVRQSAFMRDVLYSVTQGRLILCDNAESLPPRYERLSGPIVLSERSGFSELRQAARDAAASLGMQDSRIFDLITAASEAAMNAVVHVGAGIGEVSVDHASGVVQVRISDSGRGIALENLPNATLQKGYTTAGTFGHGMKLMLGTADRVYLLTGANGTTVVVEQNRAVQEENYYAHAFDAIRQ